MAIAALCGCAQQSNPTGGAKDETPPEPVTINPPPFSTYFVGNSFEMEFDEYIVESSLSSQLIISPPLNTPPEYKIRGKKLTVTWSDTLLPNTTYQFNLGKGIVDLNEGNANNNLVYVFSTGSYIDSMTVSGKVIRALDNIALPQAAVMLYTEDLDSLPRTKIPNYFALTDEAGAFRGGYLPEGNFKLFVLAEEGNNYIYDGPPEEIGFLRDPIASVQKDSARALIIPSFVEKDTAQFIKSTIAKDYGYYEVIFNVPTKKASVIFSDIRTETTLTPISLLNDRRDTLRNWVNLTGLTDLEEVQVIVRDDSVLTDTTFWYIEPDLRYKEKSVLKVTSNATRNKLDLSKALNLKFSQPLLNADTSLLFLFEDSIRVYPTEVKNDKLFRSMDISYPFSKDMTYLLSAEAGAFEDIFGNFSDSTGFGFSLQEAEFYGKFSVDVQLVDSTIKGAVIIQLSDQGGLKKEVRLEGGREINFGRLVPGAYTLKLIFDENDNGQWDSGVYDQKIQPEKVSIYAEPIEIRSNWDLDIEWIPLSAFPQN